MNYEIDKQRLCFIKHSQLSLLHACDKLSATNFPDIVLKLIDFFSKTTNFLNLIQAQQFLRKKRINFSMAINWNHKHSKKKTFLSFVYFRMKNADLKSFVCNYSIQLSKSSVHSIISLNFIFDHLSDTKNLQSTTIVSLKNAQNWYLNFSNGFTNFFFSPIDLSINPFPYFYTFQFLKFQMSFNC